MRVGDVMQRIGTGGCVDPGTLGTVCRIDHRNFDVKWETFEEPQCYGFDSLDVFVQKVSDGPTTVAEAIAAYTAACEQFEAAELALEKAKAAVQDARLNLRDALDGET